MLLLRTKTELNKSLDIAKRSYDLQELNFNLMCQNIETLISKNYLPETLTSERESLISQFEKLREHHSVYLSLISDDSSRNVLTLMSVNTE